MKDIKIAVACHKASILPNNPLFVPVQVGTALAASRLPNMRYDDEGDNISAKNPQYCELTAQYWAWKNLSADYYGLCHYRRFLCFSKTDTPRNERNQIEATVLDGYNLNRFGLENENEMRSVIETHDVVVGEPQNVSRLYTPRGNKKTAYQHWVAHDRALIRTSDLNEMLSILSDVNPEVGRDAREYLNSNTFLGFNCFVMSKSLFQELCSLEFKVLEILENRVDLSHYNQQLQRIFGFMGEIISSSFVYHLEKTGKYKIKHVPLVYFNYTDTIPSYSPAYSDAIAVVFFQSTEPSFMFGTVWNSFLTHIDSNCKYDILVEIDALSPFIKKTFSDLAKEHPNLSLRFIDHTLLRDVCHERFSKKDIPILPLLPWFLSGYDKVLVFGTHLIFNKSIVSLWNEKLTDEQWIAAPPDVLMLAKINDIFADTAENHLRQQMENPYNYFSSDVLLWDLQKFRAHIQLSDVLNAYWDNQGNPRNASEILNILCENHCKKLSQKWNTLTDSNDYLKKQLPFAPASTFKDLQTARKDPFILSYLPDDPWVSQENEIAQIFWGYAKQLPIYGRYLAHLSNRCAVLVSAPVKVDLVDRFFPIGSKRREAMKNLLPRSSKRYWKVMAFLKRFHLKF